MTTKRVYRKHGKSHTTWLEVQSWISAREAFSNSSGTFQGRPVDQGIVPFILGRLPEELIDDLRNVTTDYVIYSYNTPIAWHQSEKGWVVPDVGYSVTTTGHQNTVKAAIK